MNRGERSRLLACLPDSPRWIETRGAVLEGDYELFGSCEHCVVRVDDQRLLSVVGEPDPRLLNDSVEGLEGSWSLVCSHQDGARWLHMLPGWSLETAILHELERMPTFDPDPVAPARIKAVTEASPGLLDHLPARLGEEIGGVAGRRPMYAAWIEQRAVAFCYSAFTTETLWDVSVDTLADFRRTGLAGACAGELIRHMAAQGKLPVWGAVESNLASLGLAKKLGFRPVDRLAVLEGPDVLGKRVTG